MASVPRQPPLAPSVTSTSISPLARSTGRRRPPVGRRGASASPVRSARRVSTVSTASTASTADRCSTGWVPRRLRPGAQATSTSTWPPARFTARRRPPVGRRREPGSSARRARRASPARPGSTGRTGGRCSTDWALRRRPSAASATSISTPPRARCSARGPPPAGPQRERASLVPPVRPGSMASTGSTGTRC